MKNILIKIKVQQAKVMAQAPDLFSFVFTTEELQDILPAKAFVTEEAAEEVSQHSPAGRWHVGKWVTQTNHQEWVTFRIKQLSDGRAALKKQWVKTLALYLTATRGAGGRFGLFFSIG